MLLDLVFPPACAACDAATPRGSALCDACADSLYPIDAACPGCAEPVEGPRDVRCARCVRRPLPLTTIHAPYRFGAQLAAALRRLKFHGRRDVARTLAPLIRPALRRAAGDHDIVLPVPLHWRRAAVRGFNQSQLLLAHAGAGLPLAAPVLRRPRATRPQPGLDRAARASNLAGAFVVPRAYGGTIEGRRVLVFDDVVTTGATMAACARALLEAGATSVAGFAVARAESMR